jgi:hypothetical protein
MSKEKREEKLYQEFENILKNEGDGIEMKIFLNKNYFKFNKDIQNKIVSILFTKSLSKLTKKKKYSQVALEAIKMVNKMSDLENDIETKIKVVDIKNSIKNSN